MRDFSPTTAGCRSTPRPCASAARLPLTDIIDACARRGIRAISPWRDQVAAAGLDAHRRSCVRDARPRALGLLPRRHVPGADAAGPAAPRSTTTGARSTRRASSSARCLVLVVGGLPGALAGQAAHKDIAAARSEVRDGIAATARVRAQRRHAARDRAAASDVRRRPRLHQHAGAGARRVRRARPAAQRRARRRRRRLSRLVGPEARRRRSSAPASERLLAFHVCDWLVPTTDLLNDRGMMGDGVIDIPRIRGWVEAAGLRRLQRGRDLLDRQLVAAATATRCSTPASSGTGAASRT